MPRRRAVLLDAMGTLVHCPDPAGRLHDLLAAAGHPHPRAQVAGALAVEIAYYRAHMHTAFDAASLADLRRRCAVVLAGGLQAPPPPDVMAELLQHTFTFRVHPDVPAALDALEALGVARAVVSNWDASLEQHLQDLGLRARVGAVVVSAAVGVAKPHPAIFHHACRALGVAPADVLHCGDDAVNDRDGAAAAGCAAVLLDRSGRDPGAIASLAALPARVEAWLRDDRAARGQRASDP